MPPYLRWWVHSLWWKLGGEMESGFRRPPAFFDVAGGVRVQDIVVVLACLLGLFVFRAPDSFDLSPTWRLEKQAAKHSNQQAMDIMWVSRKFVHVTACTKNVEWMRFFFTSGHNRLLQILIVIASTVIHYNIIFSSFYLYNIHKCIYLLDF